MASRQTEELVSVLLYSYLSGDDAMTAKEVAEALGVSPSTAARRAVKAFDEDGGWVRITYAKKRVDVVDKNYGGVRGSREVDAWTVTKRYLGELLKGARSQLPFGGM